MILRPYQLAAGTAWGAARACDAHARGVVVLPTGCGKTALGLWIASTSGRTLWLAHRDELIEQPLAAIREHYPHLDARAVAAERDGVMARDVVVGSVQTLRIDRRLARLVASGACDLVVIDECHHAPASSYRKILDAVAGSCPVLGLTATPERSDGVSLSEVFAEEPVYHYSITAAQAEGWLVPHVARRVELADLDLSACGLDRHGDYRVKDLSREMMAGVVVEAVAQTVAGVVEDGRRPLVFVPSVEVSQAVSGALRARGVASEHLDGKTPRDERRARLARHRAGETRALVNCAVLTEGYDDPALDAIVIARATTSPGLYVQMAGRGLRSCCACGAIRLGQPCSCAKADCLLVDLVGAHAAHGLCTAETLAPADGAEPGSAQSAGADEAAAIAAELGGAFAAAPREDDPRLRAFLAALAGERDLSSRVAGRPTRWVSVQPERAYALSLGRDEGMLMLERADDAWGERWEVVHYPRERKAPATVLGEAGGLDAAQRIGEASASDLGSTVLMASDARWRSREASEAMRGALKRWRIHVPQGAPLSAGEASRLLDQAVAKATFRSRGKRERVMASAP